MPENTKAHGTTVQARISAETAKKFDAVKRLLGMTDAQLLRHAIDVMIKHEAMHLEEYLAERLRIIDEAREILAS